MITLTDERLRAAVMVALDDVARTSCRLHLSHEQAHLVAVAVLARASGACPPWLERRRVDADGYRLLRIDL